MSDRDLLLIERYYRAELSDAEQAEFEKRLQEDAEFRKEAGRYNMAMESIRLNSRELFKKELGQRPLIKSPGRRQWFWTGIATGIVLTLGLIYVFNKSPRPVPAQNTPSGTIKEDSLQPQRPDAVPVDSGNNKLPPQPQAAARTPARIFAAHYRPFENNLTKQAGVRSGSAGSNPDSIFSRFLALYQTKRYPEAIQLYNTLPALRRSDDNNLFFYANALLAAGKTAQAEDVFDTILRQGISDYLDETRWYAALCAIKLGDFPSAKKHLNVLAGGNNTVYQTEAANLLKELPD
ncbi:MAG: tetratricopeptide repeat protein [Thermoanaerobaculia bacterium]|nr:tetratricopeptide repeat protein [Thermoanaerobaculia bacterium]